MKLEILVNTAYGVWTALDTYGDVPALTLQINDLAELKDRRTTYSQSIVLPRSPQNCEIFGNVQVFEKVSNIPYVIRACAVYVDGVEIIPPTYRLELLGIEDNDFKCQITSNIRGLFDILEGLPFEALDGQHPTFDPFMWGISEVGAPHQLGDRYRFLSAGVGRTLERNGTEEFSMGGGYKSTNGVGSVMPAQFYPYMSLHETVKAILELQGFHNLSIEPPGMVEASQYYYSLPRVTAKADSFGNLEKSFTSAVRRIPADDPLQPTYSSLTVNGLGSNNFTHNAITHLQGMPNPFPDFPASTTGCFCYEASGFYRMKFLIDLHWANPSSISGGQLVLGVWKRRRMTDDAESREFFETDEIGFVERGVNGTWETPEFDTAPGDRVLIMAWLRSATTADYWIEVRSQINKEESESSPGCKIYPALSTDFQTQLDPIRIFLQAHGLNVEIDGTTIRMRAISLPIDKARDREFIDWTDKLDMSSDIRKTFRLGSYAQKNVILFNKNDTLEFQSSDYFEVHDETLPLTKDLFTIAAESTRTEPLLRPLHTGISYGETSVRWVAETWNRWAGAFEGADVAWNNRWQLVDAKMHLVESPYPSSSWSYAMRYTPNHSASHTTLSSMKFAIAPYIKSFESGYYDFENHILKPVRIIEADFYLTPTDIAELDMMQPVFLAQYGEYFYVQKINNYRAQRLTRVTLISLNIAKNS